MSDLKTDSRKTVVIVGGGYVGADTAKTLAQKLDTTKHRLVLITASPKFVHYPSTPRCLTTAKGALENHSFMEYGNFLKGKGEIVHATVQSIEPSKDESKKDGLVRLDNGESVRYDVLVLATGNKWPAPVDFPREEKALKEHIQSWRAKIEKAKSIVFVGAGIVGVEWAAEILDFHQYSGKNVTIVHNGRLPLNDVYPDRFRNDILNRLRKLGVNVVLEDSLESLTPSDNGEVVTKKGKTIPADLVIPTFGGKPNTSMIASSLGPSVLSPTKHINILPTFQLPAYPNIFAEGDIIEWNEQRQAAKAYGHTAVVVKNVLAILNGQEPKALYKGQYEITIISLGRTRGIAYFGVLWGIIIGDWFSAFIKSKDLMLGMAKKGFGFA